MSFVKEFKEFALKGNIVDLAIAVIVGAAFGAIVSSLVEDIITPLLLAPALKAANVQNIDQLAWGAVKYGKFLSSVINFTIIAFVLFLVVKGMMKMKREKKVAEAVAPELSLQEEMLVDIRNILKDQENTKRNFQKV